MGTSNRGKLLAALHLEGTRRGSRSWLLGGGVGKERPLMGAASAGDFPRMLGRSGGWRGRQIRVHPGPWGMSPREGG